MDRTTLQQKATSHGPDADLVGRSNEQLRAEVMLLREAVRYHRDQEEDDRCHEDDSLLYNLLPERKPANTGLPPKSVFLRSCERFWEQRQKCHAPTANVKNEALVEKLLEEAEFLGDYAAKVEFARLLVEHGVYFQADSFLKHERRRRNGGVR